MVTDFEGKGRIVLSTERTFPTVSVRKTEESAVG